MLMVDLHVHVAMKMNLINACVPLTLYEDTPTNIYAT